MTTTHRPATARLARGSGRGADRAFVLLRTLFTVAPIAFGADKFLGLLTDWDQYLAPWIDHLVPGTAHQAMLAVGVVEIVAGLVVALWPRYGGLLVAGWLAGIVVDLVTLGKLLRRGAARRRSARRGARADGAGVGPGRPPTRQLVTSFAEKRAQAAPQNTTA